MPLIFFVSAFSAVETSAICGFQFCAKHPRMIFFRARNPLNASEALIKKIIKNALNNIGLALSRSMGWDTAGIGKPTIA